MKYRIEQANIQASRAIGFFSHSLHGVELCVTVLEKDESSVLRQQPSWYLL